MRSGFVRLSGGALGVGLLVGTLSCGREAVQAPSAAQIRGATTCDAGAARTDLLLVDQQPEVRADLEAATRRGLAVVHFDCSTFVVLSHCSVDAAYEFAPHTPKQQLLRFQDGASVSASLPLTYAAHAAELAAGFDQGRSLDLALVMSGRLTTQSWGVSSEDLRGDCQGATHVVSSAEVGAFALHSGVRSQTVTAAGLFGAGVDTRNAQGFELHAAEGSPAACAKQGAPYPGCDAMLRVELVTLRAPSPLLTALTEEQMQPLRGKLCEDVELCRAECKKDDADACMQYATLHLLGDRVARDLGRAGKFMLRACELDQPLACTLLGIEMLNEASPHPDLARGRDYLRRPCERGYAEACHALGLSYANAGDRREAGRYLQRACTLGASDACQ
ncbi:MAG: sel1 repeat family protein [Polyangiaceae bacterium]|nr:sel1 repeat family protein [Myxococcales bacterium]MCB9590484.1 sel1 repeat family protein [Polyangiaceae bacterium]